MTGNLDDLNSIIVPDPVGWLPLAAGWKVLLVLLALAAGVFAWRAWLRWRENRYRRQALRELEVMENLTTLPALLKRAALSAYPRHRVAALHGPAWHRFLDEQAGMTAFQDRCGPWLDQLAYGAAAPAPSSEDARRLRSAAETWLRRHRRSP